MPLHAMPTEHVDDSMTVNSKEPKHLASPTSGRFSLDFAELFSGSECRDPQPLNLCGNVVFGEETSIAGFLNGWV